MSNVRVYIVEEFLPVQRALADRLRGSGALSVVGQSGDFALAMKEISQIQPDVVLMEIKRRDGLGLEMLRRLSELDPRPVLIVLTSYPAVWEEKASLRAGAQEYCVKEIEAQELIARIQQFVNEG